MEPGLRLSIYVVAALAILALIAGILMYSLPRGVEEGGLRVILLFPGIQGDVRRILAGDDFLYVVGLGADPHEVQLTPKDVEVLKSAHVIIGMGHTHVDKNVERLVGRGDIKARLVNILDIKGLILPKLPGEDQVNYHEPYYDPRNLEIILSEIVKVLAELRPEEKKYYEERLAEVEKEIDKVRERADYLRGCKAIIASAELQPAIQWLGLKIIWYVVFEYAEAPSPERIEKAVKAMEGEDKDKIIIVIGLVGNKSGFISKLDERLKEEARNRGLKVLGVTPGYVGGSIIDNLKGIIEHLEMENVKGC